MVKEKPVLSIEVILKKARNSCGAIVTLTGAFLPTIIFLFTAVQDIHESTMNLARYIEPAMQKALADDGNLSNEEIVSAFKELNSFDPVFYVALHDADGRFITNWHRQKDDLSIAQLPKGDFERNHLLVYSKYFFKVPDTNSGYYIVVGLNSITYIQNMAFAYLCGTAIVILVTLLAIFSIWRFVHTSLITPIMNLSNKTAEFLESGDLNFRLPMTEINEIGTISQNINALIAQVKETLLSVKTVSSQINAIVRDIIRSSDTLTSYANQYGMATKQNGENVHELVTAFRRVTERLDSLTSQVEIGATTIHEMAQINQESIGNVTSMNDSVSESMTVLEQLTTSIKSTANHINNLQTNTATVTASMQRMTQTVAEEDQNSQESMILARKLAADALKGQQTMQKAGDGIIKIQESTTQVFNAIKILNQHAIEIGSILGIIDEVSKQTSLLALNADIIAVQAGEHGRGFDIVAQELATLAASTETAASEVSTLIQSIQQAGKEVVEVMDQEQQLISAGVANGQRCTMIYSNLQGLATSSAEQAQIIANESVEQANVVQIVASTIEGINQAIQEISTSSQNQSADASALSNSAVQMKQLTQQVDISTSEQNTSSQQVLAAINEINSFAVETKRQQIAQGEATKSTIDMILSMGKNAETQSRETTRLGELVHNISQQIDQLNEQLGDIKA